MLENGVRKRFRPDEVNATARVRVIRAIKIRLGELGMTYRAFGRAFSANEGKGHGDQWVSNLLANKHALSLDELDEAAQILKTKAAELVRGPHDHSDYLTPYEREFLATLRSLPQPIREHVTMLAHYLKGVAPEEVDHLMDYRELTADEQARVQHWTRALRIAREPVPGLAILPDLPETAGPRDASARRTHGRKR